MNYISIYSKDFVFKRGMVIWAKDLYKNEDGSESHHPYVLLSNQFANGGGCVVGCMLSTNISRLDLPWNVLIQDYSKLEVSIVKAMDIYCIPKDNIEGLITYLRDEDLLRVDRALRKILDLRAKEVVNKTPSSSNIYCVRNIEGHVDA